MIRHPVQTVDLEEVEPRPQLEPANVFAQIIRSAATGLALAGLVVTLLIRLDVAGGWITFWGFAAFCAYSAARMVLYDTSDDARAAAQGRRWVVAVADLQAQVEESDETIGEQAETVRRLRADLAQAIWQRDQLMRAETPAFVPRSDAGDSALVDARIMLEMRYNSGRHPSREQLRASGWSDARIAAATQVLSAAGVLDMSDSRHPKWNGTAQEAAERLAQYAQGG